MSMLRAVWSNDYSYYVAYTASEAEAYEYEITGELPHPDDFGFGTVPHWKVIARWDGEIGEGKLRRRWAWVWALLNGRGFLMATEN